MEGYRRRNTDWLAACSYGIGLHWTAQSTPRHGSPAPFDRAVESFSVEALVSQVSRAGADYVIFTSTHALQMLPCPCDAVDRVLPGRTCRRDLLGELANALRVAGKHLIVYYNHSCNRGDDPEWELAVGYHARDKEPFAANLQAIVRELGERYGDLVKAWWFDSSYSLDPRGPENTISTNMDGWQFPWEAWSESAHAGYSDRLVCFNAGMDRTFLYTEHQDYWAGELRKLANPATSRFLENGLQWHGWTCLEDPRWVHSRLNAEVPPPLYAVPELVRFVQDCNRWGGPVTFNAIIYQDGTLAASSLDALEEVGQSIAHSGSPDGEEARPPD